MTKIVEKVTGNAAYELPPLARESYNIEAE
jgi:hypothetical protein